MPFGLSWFDYAVSKWGRKYTLAIFAGVSAFVATLLAVWVVARVSVETARIVEQLVSGYIYSAVGMVGAYTAGNAIVERAHAGKPVAVRPSGAVVTPDEVT